MLNGSTIPTHSSRYTNTTDVRKRRGRGTNTTDVVRRRGGCANNERRGMICVVGSSGVWDLWESFLGKGCSHGHCFRLYLFYVLYADDILVIFFLADDILARETLNFNVIKFN